MMMVMQFLELLFLLLLSLLFVVLLRLFVVIDCADGVRLFPSGGRERPAVATHG